MRRFALPLVAGAACLGSASHAASGGPLGTLAIGRYDCELPGQPGGLLSRPDVTASFRIIGSSRYLGADGRPGTYLLTGDTVTMTSGPLAGTRLLRLRPKFLRRIDTNGTPGELRCVLANRTDGR